MAPQEPRMCWYTLGTGSWKELESAKNLFGDRDLEQGLVALGGATEKGTYTSHNLFFCLRGEGNFCA